MGYCLLTLAIELHETLTEADSSISHPLIALLVALLGLTAEAPCFSQRPNNNLYFICFLLLLMLQMVSQKTRL